MALETNELDKHFLHVEAHKKLNREKIEAVKEWFKTQPHLPDVSERQISIFLHACYGSVEVTQKTIENYYTMRTNDPDTFDGRMYESFIEVFNVTYCFISPSLSLDNCHCYFFGLVDNDPRKYVILEIGRLSQTMIDLGSNLYPYSNGWRLFIDAGDYTFGHLLKVSMSLGYMKGYLNYVQSAMPIRLKGIHIYNSSPVVGQIIALLKPFIDRKLYDMIHTYTRSEMNSLFEFIRPELLPVSSGGEVCPEEMRKDTLDTIKKYEQWFIDDARLGRTDESKRKRKPGKLSWLFGYGATTEDNSQEDKENETREN